MFEYKNKYLVLLFVYYYTSIFTAASIHHFIFRGENETFNFNRFSFDYTETAGSKKRRREDKNDEDFKETDMLMMI